MKSIRWSIIALVVCMLFSGLPGTIAEESIIDDDILFCKEPIIFEQSEDIDEDVSVSEEDGDSASEDDPVISAEVEPVVEEEEIELDVESNPLIMDNAVDQFPKGDTLKEDASINHESNIINNDLYNEEPQVYIIETPRAYYDVFDNYVTVGDFTLCISTYYILDEYYNETCYIHSYNGSARNLVMPEKLGGHDIHGISTNAFSGNGYLRNVTFPKSTRIGKAAFKNCRNLESVTFNGKEYDINEEAFSGCSNLKTANLSKSVTRFSCGKNAFYCCVSLRSITLPGLGPWEECFVNCYNLCVSFNFESNYSSAYMEEFIDNSNIKEIHIPDCVESIGDYDLRGCTGAIIKIYSTDIDEIGEGAFDGCKEVQVIKGSKTHKYCKAHKIKVKTFDPYAPSGIALKASGSTLLTPKKGIQLTATLSPSNARSKLTWKSSKKSVATVSKNGYVKAKKKGTTTITVKTRNGKKASIKITVKANPKKVTLSSKSLALSVGKTAQLTATLPKNTYATLSYSSSNAGVAKVDQSGKVTAVKGGQTTITVTTSNGKKASCLVTVLSGPAPTTLTLNATNCVLKPKGKFTIVPKINSGASTAYTYSTSNKKVATVAADGTIKAKKKGKAVITVRTHNGLTATVNVTVKAK